MKTDMEDYEIRFVRWITTRNGRRIYAHQFRKKAFAIRVRRSPPS